MVKKVRKYKLETGIEKWLGKKKDDYEIRDYIFVVEGPKGVVVSYRSEGIHWIYDSLDEPFGIDVYKKPGDGVISAAPSFTIEVPLREITETCECEECDVKDMVRIFGSRLDANYRLLLKSLKKIGLNLKEYNTERK